MRGPGFDSQCGRRLWLYSHQRPPLLCDHILQELRIIMFNLYHLGATIFSTDGSIKKTLMNFYIPRVLIRMIQSVFRFVKFCRLDTWTCTFDRRRGRSLVKSVFVPGKDLRRWARDCYRGLYFTWRYHDLGTNHHHLCRPPRL